MIQIITLFHLGSPSDGVPSLKVILRVAMFIILTRRVEVCIGLRRVMSIIKYFGIQHGVWKPHDATNYSDSESITNLWDGICPDIGSFLVTETEMDNDAGLL